MSVVINNEQYERMSCGQCGIVFYVPEHFREERLNDGDGWHCPNGHSRVFTEPKVEILEKQLDEKIALIERLENDQIMFEAGIENREMELEKLRKRVKKLKAGA